jgi:hypothetical protein
MHNPANASTHHLRLIPPQLQRIQPSLEGRHECLRCHPLHRPPHGNARLPLPLHVSAPALQTADYVSMHELLQTSLYQLFFMAVHTGVVLIL